MTVISPSILAANFLELQSEIDVFKDQKDVWLHLDVMDGHFVPNMTFGIPIIKQLSKQTSLPLDVHLMVTNPKFYYDELAELGLENITFHYEATKDPLHLITHAKTLNLKRVGISIKPNTSVDVLTLDILKSINVVLIMSVEPGFGGQKFMASSLDKIKKLCDLRKQHGLNFHIQIDGGINEDTFKLALEAGADNLVAGSYIFKNDKTEYINKVNSLRK